MLKADAVQICSKFWDTQYIFYFNDLAILLIYFVVWQCRSFLAGLLQYLVKNMSLLVQKFCEEFFFVKIRFRLF